MILVNDSLETPLVDLVKEDSIHKMFPKKNCSIMCKIETKEIEMEIEYKHGAKSISYLRATKVRKKVALPGRLFASKGMISAGLSISLIVLNRAPPIVTPIKTFRIVK